MAKFNAFVETDEGNLRVGLLSQNQKLMRVTYPWEIFLIIFF